MDVPAVREIGLGSYTSRAVRSGELFIVSQNLITSMKMTYREFLQGFLRDRRIGWHLEQGQRYRVSS
jgi:hypothetical protein